MTVRKATYVSAENLMPGDVARPKDLPPWQHRLVHLVERVDEGRVRVHLRHPADIRRGIVHPYTYVRPADEVWEVTATEEGES